MSRWHVAVEAAVVDMEAAGEAMGVAGAGTSAVGAAGTWVAADSAAGTWAAAPPSVAGVSAAEVLPAGPWAGGECPVERFGAVAGPSAGARWEAAWPLAERSAGTRPVPSARGAREGCGRRCHRTAAASGPLAQDRPSPVAPEWE